MYNNRPNRNESRRPYSSQGSYSSRSESRWNNRDENRDRNFSSFNEDQEARDYNMDGSGYNSHPKASSRRDWDFEGGTHNEYGHGNNDIRYGTDRYSMNDRNESRNFDRGSERNSDRSRENSRDFSRSASDRSNNERSRYGRDSYSSNYESSRFNQDRESDSSPSYGSYGRDYSSQNYSDRDISGSTSYSGRGDRLREDSYGSSRRDSSRMSSYEGRGPKSYTRSDDRIKEEVCDMLTRHSEIDASEIEVEVKDGVVTLLGTVSERRMKHQAEDLAERISSVKDVTNNIRVQKESTHDWSSSSDLNSQSEMGASENSISKKGTGTSGKPASSSASSSSTSTNQNPNH
ncbi:BON domain-containing protein [Bdellovibrio sp. HCB209]|uniref:BON domain-containing protein n=1 Tax=Bdellovibrio sp. HCB209 TaxID=3394354 RepID=UPI0039B4237C